MQRLPVTLTLGKSKCHAASRKPVERNNRHSPANTGQSARRQWWRPCSTRLRRKSPRTRSLRHARPEQTVCGRRLSLTSRCSFRGRAFPFFTETRDALSFCFYAIPDAKPLHTFPGIAREIRIATSDQHRRLRVSCALVWPMLVRPPGRRATRQTSPGSPDPNWRPC